MAQNSSKNGSNRYARAQPSSEKSSRPAFMSGLVIGALIMYFFPLINESSPSETAATVNKLVEKADLKELKFDFYTLLKETEILVPDDQDSANATDPEKMQSMYYRLDRSKIYGTLKISKSNYF